MNKFNLFILLLILSMISSCHKAKSFIIDKENYTVSFEQVTSSNHYKNMVQIKPLNINAEKINLKNLLAIITEADTSAIKFEDKTIGEKSYNVKITQKNDALKINKPVLQDIAKALNFKLITQVVKSYEITISDSLKLNKYFNKSNSNHSKINDSKDSFSVKNLEFSKFVNLLNKEYQDDIFYRNEYKRIGYKWKKSTLKNIEQSLLNDLGLILHNTKNDRFIYMFKET